MFDLDPGECTSWELAVRCGSARCSPRTDSVAGRNWRWYGVACDGPVEPELTLDAAHDYTRRIAERLGATEPSRYTTSAARSTAPYSMSNPPRPKRPKERARQG